MDVIELCKSHLSTQFINNPPVLFTGSGFSVGAVDQDRKLLPVGKQLAEELWPLTGLDGAFDPQNSLQDVFELAVRKNATKLTQYVKRRLHVVPDALPDHFRVFFGLPWSRFYTLNVDDLEIAVSLRFPLPLKPVPISATGLMIAGEPARAVGAGDLEVIHLNGTLDDLPNHVTFSRIQYADRSILADPSYTRLIADLNARSVVFVGTELEEPSLWQHIVLRQKRGGRELRELRPRSYLVCPTLAPAKREVLADYNVAWIQMDAAGFANTVLSAVSVELEKRRPDSRSSHHEVQVGLAPQIPKVASLARRGASGRAGDYLLGHEPEWSDIMEDRAIVREVDERLAERARSYLSGGTAPLILVLTGTAGSGKTSSLLRLSLRLSNAGTVVGFIDRQVELSPRQLIAAVEADSDLSTIAIDDADRYGDSLTETLNQIVQSRKRILVLIGIRSTKLESRLRPDWIRGAELAEVTMPPLSDADIDGLIETLDRSNRLGRLKGWNHARQRDAFREQAGRQLLVAMIQATTGRRFEEKVVEEYLEIGGRERTLYAIIATATACGFFLTRSQVLVASGDQSNETLNELDNLVRRGLVDHPRSTAENCYAARHREIARVVADYLAGEKQLHVPIGAVAFAAASEAPFVGRTSRSMRLLKAIINHRFLHERVGLARARGIYESVENLLRGNSHYWLQRGSLEVQDGELQLATNFMDQARGINPDDPLIETEYAHLQLRLAIEEPHRQDARALVSEALATLKTQIDERGKKDSYPYHILGSQMIGWVRCGVVGVDERKDLLRQAQASVEEGLKRHPFVDELRTLRVDLEKELMMTAVRDANRG